MCEHQPDWDIFLQLRILPYNTKVYHSTGTTQFRLVLSGHPLRPTTFDRPSALPTGAKQTTAPHTLKVRLLHGIALMREKIDRKLIADQRRYKPHHEPHISSAGSFKPGQWVYVDHPPLPVTDADRLARTRIQNYYPKKAGSLLHPLTTTETVINDQERIPNAISSDRATLAPQSKTNKSATSSNASHQSKYP